MLKSKIETLKFVSNTQFSYKLRKLHILWNYYRHLFIDLAPVWTVLCCGCADMPPRKINICNTSLFSDFSLFFEVSSSTLQSAYTDSWLHSAYISEADTTCEDTLPHMPSYTVSILYGTNLKSITLSLVSVLNKSPPKGSTEQKLLL